MPNIIHKCHAYNKVFFLNLNKFWHSIHPFNLIPMALIAFPILGWLQDRKVNIITNHSFFDQPSIRRFCKINVSSSNDSLDCSMCMKSHQRHLVFLPSFSYPTTKGF